MATKAELQAVLDCDNKPFLKALSQAERGADKTGRKLEKSLNVSGTFSKIGGALAGAFSGAAVIGFTKSIVDMGGELQDAADGLNINTDALQGLGFAFSQSGASQETFQKGMVKLNQTITDALEGNEKLLAAFGRMGVSFGDLESKSPDEILLMIADGAKEAQNPTQALSDILELLGKNGAKMAAGLKQGSEELKEAAKNASKFSAEELKKLDEIGDGWMEIFRTIKVGAGKAAAYLSKGLDDFGAVAPDFKPGQKVPNTELPKDTGQPEPPAPRSARAREIFDTWRDQMDAAEKKEKEHAAEMEKIISEDLKQRGELAMEIQAIEARTFDIEREAARAEMDSAQLLVSLEEERAQWVKRAVDWEQDRFQLHMKDAALARQEAARLAASIKALKANGQKTGEQSMFASRGEMMREEMMKASGLGIYGGRSRSSNWVFNQGTRLGASSDTLSKQGMGLSTGGLSTGGLGGFDSAYGKIRKGDAARAREAARSGASGAVATTDSVVAANTAELVRLWGGGGKTQ